MQFRGHSDSVLTLAWSNERKMLISGSKDKTLKVWNYSSGEEIKTIFGHSGWIRKVIIDSNL